MAIILVLLALMSNVEVTSDAVILKRASGASCEVAFFGAHVRSWKLADGAEQIYVSSASKAAPAALRGGVPICFPQFADRGPGGKHGFARTSSKWRLISSSSEPSPTCSFELRADDETRSSFPCEFRLLYHVTLASDATLALAMQVLNESEEPAEFTTALHTYMRVADATTARIEGLAGTVYEDCAIEKGADGKPPRKTEESEQLALVGEVDRVYLATPASLLLTDGARKVRILATGFKDTVVWNIGEAKASSLNDLGAGEWRQYVCVESAVIDKPVKLGPKSSWMGGVSYTSL